MRRLSHVAPRRVTLSSQRTARVDQQQRDEREGRGLPRHTRAIRVCLRCGIACAVLPMQNLVEKIVRLKVYSMTYWKEHCFGLNAETLVDKAMDLDHVGGTYGGNQKATDFLCLVLKMCQIQPEKEIVVRGSHVLLPLIHTHRRLPKQRLFPRRSFQTLGWPFQRGRRPPMRALGGLPTALNSAWSPSRLAGTRMGL